MEVCLIAILALQPTSQFLEWLQQLLQCHSLPQLQRCRLYLKHAQQCPFDVCTISCWKMKHLLRAGPYAEGSTVASEQCRYSLTTDICIEQTDFLIHYLILGIRVLDMTSESQGL
jgi:hypothetical protein